MWIIGWSSQVIATIGGKAKLSIGQIRSNVSKRLFKFNPPTYTIVEVPKGLPWSALASSGGTDFSGSAQPAPESTAADSGTASSVPVPETGAVSTEGSVSSEGAQAAPVPETAATEALPAQAETPAASSSSANGGLGEVKPESAAGEVNAETSSASDAGSASSAGGIKAETPSSEVPVEVSAGTPATTQSPPPPTPTPPSSDVSSEGSSSVGAPRPEGAGTVRLEGKPAPADTATPSPDVDKTQAASASSPSSSGSSASASKASSDIGMPKSESGTVRAESNVFNAAITTKDDDDHGDHGPVVRQWTPADDRPPAPPAQSRMEDDDSQKCPEGTKLNGLTGVCDSAPMENGEGLVGSILSSMPSGYGSVLAASAGSLVSLAVLMNCWPQLKGILLGLAGKSSGAPLAPSARFKDIGHRREEEERGLMSSSLDEDDVL